MEGSEKRREPRVKAEALPARYREFSILLSHGQEAVVRTSDASLSGFGFYSDLPCEHFVVGTRLVLYPLGDEHPLFGIIVHCQATERGSRVGVHLQALGGYHTYAEQMAAYFG
jgi:hypothetical protein